MHTIHMVLRPQVRLAWDEQADHVAFTREQMTLVGIAATRIPLASMEAPSHVSKEQRAIWKAMVVEGVEGRPALLSDWLFAVESLRYPAKVYGTAHAVKNRTWRHKQAREAPTGTERALAPRHPPPSALAAATLPPPRSPPPRIEGVPTKSEAKP